MIQLTPLQLETLRNWFTPERPGPLVGLHVLQTGNGQCFVDCWPNSRTLLVNTADNYMLAGDPETLTPDDLQLRIAGFVEAPERFAPLLQVAFPDLKVWDRVVFELKTKPALGLPAKQLIRRLEPDDVYHLQRMLPEINWIWNTWDGPERLAASGYAWGAFANERLVSVACSFFVGDHYEDIGVVTESEFRGLGLSVACAGKLCEDIQSRGKQPSWTTSPDNLASVRVAEKLGFVLHRHDVLYVTGVSIPEPARRN